MNYDIFDTYVWNELEQLIVQVWQDFLEEVRMVQECYSKTNKNIDKGEYEK